MQQAISRLQSQQALGREERERARTKLKKLTTDDTILEKEKTIIWWSAWISAMETATDIVRVCPCKHGQGGYDEITEEEVEVSL